MRFGGNVDTIGLALWTQSHVCIYLCFFFSPCFLGTLARVFRGEAVGKQLPAAELKGKLVQQKEEVVREKKKTLAGAKRSP